MSLLLRYLGVPSALCLLGGVPATHSLAATLPESPAGLTVSVDEKTGNYTVGVHNPAWIFSGSIGAPVQNVKVNQGKDRIGSYQEIAFRWEATVPVTGTIRSYADRPAVLFSWTSLKPTDKPAAEFPAFTEFPQGLHPFSYGSGAFAAPAFRLQSNATPWLLFDDQDNACVLSPASDFFVSQMTGDGKTSLASSLRTTLSHIPANFDHQTLMVVGQGIRPTFLAWGNTLTTLMGRTAPTNDADPLLKYFGYWTDNGANYYYKYDTDKGYAGTVVAVSQHYKQEDIPIRYLQLDSWWYQKSKLSPSGKMGATKNPNLPEGTWNAYGGTLQYTASPDLFPKGLAPFQVAVGLPLAVHGRWIDINSPYRQNYKISGVAPVDPKWWDMTARYMKDNGIVTYEQDWLSDIYANSPEMSHTVDTGAAFTDNMARACREQGMTMQYCMAPSAFFLQGAKYNNLTTIRVSGDRFERRKWNHFFYTSLYAQALGIWPWTDVFMSTELDNLLLSTLSAGPVGTGDAIGSESKENIRLAVRDGDGVIVKPDVPIVPSDQSFIADAGKTHQPLVAWTYTEQPSAPRTVYVFAYPREGDTDAVSFTPASFGLTGRAYIYRYFDKAGAAIDTASPYSDTIGEHRSAYYVIAPVGKSGIAFLGDAGKFVGTGRQRTSTIQDEPGKLTVTVTFAPGEKSVVLHGFAPSAPTVTATDGESSAVAYDTATQHFTVTVSPSATTKKVGGETVQQATIVLKH